MGEQPQIEHVHPLLQGDGPGGLIKGLEVNGRLYLEKEHPGQIQKQAEKTENEAGYKSSGQLKHLHGSAKPGPEQPKAEEQPAGQNKGQNITGALQLAEGAKKHPQS